MTSGAYLFCIALYMFNFVETIAVIVQLSLTQFQHGTIYLIVYTITVDVVLFRTRGKVCLQI
jgi:hypothetical protein